MKITLSANGYQGLKAEVAEILENGARVILNRKGIDLAPRTFYFTWDAIKGGKIEMPEAPKPATQVVTIKGDRKSWTVEIPTEPTYGHTIEDDFRKVTRTINRWVLPQVVGSIAGAKAHVLNHTVDQTIEVDANGTEVRNEYHEGYSPACGTGRHAKTGGHYINNIRLAEEVTCAKCGK
jgi:hypothetical protein